LESFAERWRDEALRSRIIVIGKLPVDADRLPGLLRGPPTYQFFEIDEATKDVREFFVHGRVLDHDRYFERIEKIATHLGHLMGTVRASPVGGPRRTPDRLTINELIARRVAALIAKSQPHRAEDTPLVFINAADVDKPNALELRDKLEDMLGGRLFCATPVSFYDNAAAHRRKDLVEKFIRCDGLVTVWGDAPETWLRAMLREYRKLMPRRPVPLRANMLAPTELRRREAGKFREAGLRVVALDEVATSLESLLLSDMRPRSLSAAATLGADAGGAVTEIVELSAFAPPSVKPADEILVQIFLHCPDARAAAAALAKGADPDTTARGIATLSTELARGQTLGIALEAPGLSVEEAVQYVTWRGDPCACQFLVSVPADAAGHVFHLRVRALLQSVPIGVLRFTLRATTARERPDFKMTMQGDFAKRYRYAFLSYASSDRAEVIKRAMMLKAVGIEFFLDLLNLDPGERWERELFREIDRCDVFFLFWSSNAAGSKWVVREAKYALDRQEASDEEEPDIRPIIIEGPPVSPPPESLRKIHFNDPLCYVLAGVEAERQHSRNEQK
jgi:TIR domain